MVVDDDDDEYYAAEQWKILTVINRAFKNINQPCKSFSLPKTIQISVSQKQQAKVCS